MLKKIEIAKNIAINNIEKFLCPKCRENFSVKEHSLVCKNGHCYDLSKKGTVNFLSGKASENYGKELFEARKKIILSGFYNPLISTLNEMIKGSSVLDIGCGEGSFIKLLSVENRTFFGIDISKEGINSASEYTGNFFAVADLANLPFSDNSFDTLLNVFSPSNYAEFKRILKTDGVLIKVIPNKGYLKELREFYNINTDYDNTPVMEIFKNHFEILEQKRVNYTTCVTNENLPYLLEMTPLMWNKANKSGFDINEITVDVTVVVGKKK
ncbi:MAG: methyltransferase domain-containing protein [Clostridia bacterium]|nr:methyltransferase domain-containing protein [Clostridia bacterium]